MDHFITIALTKEEFDELKDIVTARDDGAAQFICGYLLGKAEKVFMVDSQKENDN